MMEELKNAEIIKPKEFMMKQRKIKLQGRVEAWYVGNVRREGRQADSSPNQLLSITSPD
jgi:hypothetical protein